jgi:hypothetical protein
VKRIEQRAKLRIAKCELRIDERRKAHGARHKGRELEVGGAALRALWLEAKEIFLYMICRLKPPTSDLNRLSFP